MLGNSALSGSMATQLMARADGCDGTAPDGKLSSGEFIAGLHGIGDGAFLRVSVHLSLYIYRALSIYIIALSLSLSLSHTHTHTHTLSLSLSLSCTLSRALTLSPCSITPSLFSFSLALL